MSITMERLLIEPVPVDLRLCVLEVTMGWKTIEQVEAEMAAKPDGVIARRVRALALVPGVTAALDGADVNVHSRGGSTARPPTKRSRKSCRDGRRSRTASSSST